MARRKRRGRGGRRVAVIVLGALVLGMAWWYLHRPQAVPPNPPVRASTPPVSTGPVAVAADRVDARNEGRRIRLAGELRAAAPVRDPLFGIAADALALERTVEMLQWAEDCAGGTCRYRLDWAGKPVDSGAFREPRGHANATAFPFRSQRFVAASAKIGAFAVDVRAIDDVDARADRTVHASELPPNLAASLRDCDGMLCTGNPDKPAAGDLRIRWRVVPPARVVLAGTQRGNHLETGH